jgi:hypothetical protein
VAARQIIALTSEKGFIMKIKSKDISSSTKDQSKIIIESAPRQKNWRQIRMQLAAIFLVIVFLASECATLLPME